MDIDQLEASSAITEYEPVEVQQTGMTEATPAADSQEQVVVLDSLPYIDNVHPDYESYAYTLIEQEMETMKPRPLADSMTNYMATKETIPPSFERKGDNIKNKNKNKNSSVCFDLQLNKTEYAEVVARNGQPRPDPIIFSSNHFPTPPSEQTSVSEWEDALRKAKIELEHERIRLVNAELQTEYETPVWKYHNQALEERYSKPLINELQSQRMAVDKLNARRKDMQEVQAGPKLQNLEMRWADLVGKNQRLSRATISLQQEVDRLRRESDVVAGDEEMKVDDTNNS